MPIGNGDSIEAATSKKQEKFGFFEGELCPKSYRPSSAVRALSLRPSASRQRRVLRGCVAPHGAATSSDGQPVEIIGAMVLPLAGSLMVNEHVHGQTHVSSTSDGVERIGPVCIPEGIADSL